MKSLLKLLPVIAILLYANSVHAQATNITAIGDNVTADVGGRGSGASFQLTGTCTSGVVTFETTVDGVNWVTMEVIPVASSTRVTTTAVVGVWVMNVGGLNKVRMRVTDACDGGGSEGFKASIYIGSGSTKSS